MIHESNKNIEFEVIEGGVSFEEVYNKTYFPEKYRDEISTANILIIPFEKFRDKKQPFFPEETHSLFEFMKDNSDEQTKIDICISDDDFNSLHLHSDTINIPLLLTTSLAFPLAVNLISSFLMNKKNEIRDDLSTKVEIIIDDDNNNTKTIKYEGKAENFSECMKSISEDIFNKEID